MRWISEDPDALGVRAVNLQVGAAEQLKICEPLKRFIEFGFSAMIGEFAPLL
jgi:hypothetical protein